MEWGRRRRRRRRGEKGYKSSGNQRVASKRTFQRFWDDTVTGSSPRASLHRVVSISEWADQKEERHMRTNERTNERAVETEHGKSNGLGKKIVRVLLGRTVARIEDSRSFRAYASSSGVENYATTGSGSWRGYRRTKGRRWQRVVDGKPGKMWEKRAR